jgi:hypothetical protein
VSFAAKHLGGGYKNTGWVQEEIITAEFYEMAVGITEYEKLRINTMEVDECFIWLNLVRGSEALPGKYGGRHLRSETAKSFDVRKYIEPVGKNSNLINFLSIDAPNRSNKTGPYSLAELKHLFVKALAGFETCVIFKRLVIHTGNWGAGAFGNDPELIFWVQVLAAKLAGITEIHFWGTKDINNNEKIQSLITGYFSGFHNLTFNEMYDLTKGLFDINFPSDRIFEDIISS